ncbi:uncharacterized protein STEHIDRAFT_95313 [Stereum hirsutum FP-91666 SS1]|uniref:uncharacterized protein n=1 Tax=Stereum hirsutum (strain FP-91666) TaxID=721885 RepID=UPI000440CF55|nr:uncharacterized protein STEHIDRAFT_95313 [Stereum hirsutum FP-91666 SS1]EIM88263.1 hypothetical protein STEHIDRAFT_95313 [Stereum hirsutum FP-91666 SS1]
MASSLAKMAMTPVDGAPPRPTPPKRRLSIPSVGFKRILVLGSGSFGSCLADHLADVGHVVRIWSRSQETVDTFNNHNRNNKYLTDHAFSKRLRAVGPDFPPLEDLEKFDVLVFAIPTQHMGGILQKCGALFKAEQTENSRLPLLVFANKGIEIGSCYLPIEIIERELGKEVARTSTFLSGPSFAKEVCQRMPTQVTIASFSSTHAELACEVFHQPHFLTFSSADPIGVELAGALKNVYAIASGVSTGLGFGQNTRAGLVTRASAEMQMIGQQFQADPMTFLSLAGMGDLFMTCGSENSRNFTVGRRLGQGEDLKYILETLGSTAEGVETVKAAHELLERIEVKAPIAEAVYDLLYGDMKADDLAQRLMGLPSMPENLRPKVRRNSHSQRFYDSIGHMSPHVTPDASPFATPSGSPTGSPKLGATKVSGSPGSTSPRNSSSNGSPTGSPPSENGPNGKSWLASRVHSGRGGN